MATGNVNLSAFARKARQGRTQEPLDILGIETPVKLANSDARGAVVIFEQDVAPLTELPLHRHATMNGSMCCEENSPSISMANETFCR
jgi:hypothetical protein